MFRRQDEFVRVGIRLVVVMAVVAFLVLLFHGRAYPGEFRQEELTRLLLNRDPLTPAERVDAARALLRQSRERDVARVFSAGLDTAWRAATGASPSRMLRSSRRLYRGVRDLLGRSPAETRALALLEPEVEAGVQDPGLLMLYAELRSRERADQLDRWFVEAERALERGDAPRVRRRILRMQRLAPGDPRIAALQARLAEGAGRAAGEIDLDQRVRLEPRGGETPLAAALLAGNYARLIALETDTPEQALAQAAALELSGVGGGDELPRLADRPDRIGLTARRWLHDHVLGPEEGLRLAARRHRVRQTLGWLGGVDLEEHGLDPSRRGVRAWRESLTPLNVALSAPSRLLRRRPADGEDLRRAARDYLARHPRGTLASEAHEWLARTPRSAHERRRDAAWDDGVLRLPPARTRYARVAATPVVVTRELVATLPEVEAELRETLRDAPLVVLSPRAPQDPVARQQARTLDKRAARRLLSGLVHGLEAGEIDALGSRASSAREAVRRLDRALYGERELHVLPWRVSERQGGLRDLLLEGEARRVRSVDLARDGEELRARRRVRGSTRGCPEQTVCLDVSRDLLAVAYADVDLDGDVRLGASASFHEAALAIEVAMTGPRASVVVPIGRWLGLGRWLPLEAHLGVDLGGISVGPALGRPVSSDAPEGPGI